ncbi:ribbon-helix-helix protein, CopG family [Nocardia cyriacigeorgica]|uniref:Ribbon-helix-helix protein, CopG family n=1 Tax=Nocardia cyriacigeorgica TaxID=135487 RepID=A0A6P1CQI7_9NOCA|nr:ribbon-helix-helix protein, CopG family [Nocardia cyriacigeorgica]MBF6087669.1 ribbon-helix-helix protein, CopG family [Nocardia cyriacigeorgica]MBF6092400.1 ribbon-helix-helix protein, CopG family [Nocardia cyriacigeorgica]MBF6396976.1 ribbon-helix-helix protein, CopG family [Nocardia cyriacigeorgica]MBF6403366.1 ribbon-helix-helix protein, CopG family [Nocardia cyriacigeorgica]MBF6424876.1 ribbon-helix-helix protein, CopG family [Nocardia cyriacigeorgica]
MAMTLRLDDEDDRMLTERAEAEGRSKQEIAKEAIHLHLTRHREVFSALVNESLAKHAELMARLA